jgi:peptide/nickel transport system permease protein
VYGAQISLSIGLVAVAISLVLGMLFGGISGYFGGVVDLVVQRVIEIVRSLPTIPLWLALAASVPRSWSVVQVYFAITILIGLLGWTEMARIIRGRFLVLREEEFVVAAVVSGSRSARIIRRHLMPMMLGYIIAAVTLAIPDMIISETALSFLGLGLRPPAISWGVLLQSAENVQTVALAPWLMIPAACVAISVLAFNFAGDGLRDAADPHGV